MSRKARWASATKAMMSRKVRGCQSNIMTICCSDWRIFAPMSFLSPRFFFQAAYRFDTMSSNVAIPATFSSLSFPTMKAAVGKTLKSSRVGVYHAQVSGSGCR